MADPYKTTVSVSAASRDLTILETIKLELEIDDAQSDEFLLALIKDQSDAATSYCDRGFAKETLIDDFHIYFDSYNPLRLSRTPVSSVTSLVEGASTLAGTDFEYDASGGKIWRLDTSGNRTWWPSGKITVTYVGGYDLLTELPRDIERAVIIMVKQAWYDRTREPRLKSETVQDVGSYSLYEQGMHYPLPGAAADLLNKYVRYSI